MRAALARTLEKVHPGQLADALLLSFAFWKKKSVFMFFYWLNTEYHHIYSSSKKGAILGQRGHLADILGVITRFSDWD